MQSHFLTIKDDKSLKLRQSRSTKTVKNASVRCESCNSLRQSRRSEKTLAFNRKQVQSRKHESNMARLQLISRRVQPSDLIKKRHKVVHFPIP